MAQQGADAAKSVVKRGARALRRTALYLAVAVRALWATLRPPLAFALQVVAALILLFEEWGWRPLVDALAYLSRFPLFAWIERRIAGLPPYGALVALAVPTGLLFPLKLLAVYLVAKGQVVAAGLLFVGAKIASTALIARLFLLTKPALMQIGWFASLYAWLMPWKDALFALIRNSWAWRYGRMVKNRVRLEVKQAWAAVKPRLEARLQGLRTALQRIFKRA